MLDGTWNCHSNIFGWCCSEFDVAVAISLLFFSLYGERIQEDWAQILAAMLRHMDKLL